MSDYTDEMLNGDFCQECGDHLGEGDGFPVTCPSCKDDD